MPRFAISAASSYHERTFARWYDRHFDFVSLNKAAITQVIPPEHQQALVIDGFIPKMAPTPMVLRLLEQLPSGAVKKAGSLAPGLARHHDTCAYGLSVEQTLPSDKTSEPQGTCIDYLEQLRRVSDHHLKHLRYVIAMAITANGKFLDGVRALGLHQIPP